MEKKAIKSGFSHQSIFYEGVVIISRARRAISVNFSLALTHISPKRSLVVLCQAGCKSNNSRKAVMGIIYTDIACMRDISMSELTVMSCSLSENKSSR